MDPTEPAQLWGIIVTYRRPAELAEMLRKVAQQTRPPDHTIVVDNGSEPSARSAAEGAGAIYLDAGENLGPAGGIALGMQHVLSESAPHDWILSLDDDDPPPADDLIETVWRYAQDRLAADPLTAGVGCHGADYDARWGVFRRYQDHELRGDLQVSVVAGGSLPMYRVATVRTIGTFDRDLFFGFEEGEYGLRINKAGLRLYVNGAIALATRALWGKSGINSAKVRTTPNKAAWRRYYSIRNATLLAWRYARFGAPLFVALGGAAKSTIALARRRRPWREITLPTQAAVAGLLRRTGRTINPAQSYK